MRDENESKRLESKTPEHKLLQILKNEFRLAPRIAEAIVEDAQSCLQGQPNTLQPGQIRKILVRRNARHGKQMQKTDMVEVIWTVDAGRIDRELQQEKGSQALRRARVQRLLEEAVEQGAAASQEDLAQALNTSVRTIKRDFEELQGQGKVLPSRGNLKGIGRGQTHKGQIIRRWLNGETYDQVARNTHHSAASIGRYIRAFAQVIGLTERGFGENEIARLLQIGLSLVGEYLTMKKELSPEQNKRLGEQMKRFSRAAAAEKGGL